MRPMLWSERSVALVLMASSMLTACRVGDAISPSGDSAASGAVASLSGPSVRRTDLGSLGAGTYSNAFGVNALGHVVGASITNGGDFHGFLWRKTPMIDLGTLGGSFSYAEGIDLLDRVVGISTTLSGTNHAFMWQRGAMVDLDPTGAFSDAHAINSLGQIVGLAQNQVTGFQSHAVLWNRGSLIDLGTLGGTRSEAFALDLLGQIVGSSETTGAETHAFLWRRGTMIDLGTLGGNESVATGISDLGLVVGYSTTNSGDIHGFSWWHGRMYDLGTLGGSFSYAHGINAVGQIVGESLAGDGVHAVVWRNGAVADFGFGQGNAISPLGAVAGFSSTTGQAALWTIR